MVGPRLRAGTRRCRWWHGAFLGLNAAQLSVFRHELHQPGEGTTQTQPRFLVDPNTLLGSLFLAITRQL
jgi:hypothetical protein